jgi:microcystin-dependent protein
MPEHPPMPARPPRVRYVGDGAQRAFPFDFVCFRPEDVEVALDGVRVAAGFAATLAADGTGTVLFDAAPAAEIAVVLRRQLAIRRESDFQEGGELRAKTLNDELDFQTAAIQQADWAASRALRLPDEDADGVRVLLPPAAARAGRALVFDAAGDPSVSADAYRDQAQASAAGAETALQAAAAAQADAAMAAGHAAGAAQSAAGAATDAGRAEAAGVAAAASAAAVALDWIYETAAFGAPADGCFRIDGAGPASAVRLAVSATAGGFDMSDFVATWAASSNVPAKGALTLRRRGSPHAFAMFHVLSVADRGAWLEIGTAPLAASGDWPHGAVAAFAFARAGDRGFDGAGTVVSVAAADGSLALSGTQDHPRLAVAPGGIAPDRLARSASAGQVLVGNGPGADTGYAFLPPGIPAGAVMPFAGADAPDGWLFAAGQAVSRAAYAALFSVLGTTYGAGDGSTTFNVPDLRGRVAAGRDNMNGTAANRLTAGGAGIAGTTLGAAGGTETHVLTVAQVPAHTHATTIPAAYATVSTDIHENATSAFTSTSATQTGSTGGGAAHPNAQPTLVLNYIVKT